MCSNAFVSGAAGLRFKSRACQTDTVVANGSPPLQHFFKGSYVATDAMACGWAPQTRYTLRRNTASKTKESIYYNSVALRQVFPNMYKILRAKISLRRNVKKRLNVRAFLIMNFIVWASAIHYSQKRGQVFLPCLSPKIIIINSTPDCAHVDLTIIIATSFHFSKFIDKKTG